MKIKTVIHDFETLIRLVGSIGIRSPFQYGLIALAIWIVLNLSSIMRVTLGCNSTIGSIAVQRNNDKVNESLEMTKSMLRGARNNKNDIGRSFQREN